VFEKVVFADDWATEETELKTGISSIIPCPASLERFKKEWPYIKSCGEPYTPELLKQLGAYADFHFYVPETEQVDDCLWLPCYDLELFQKAAVVEMLNRKRLGIFFDTGTGKTVLAVQYIYNRLINKSGLNVLIVTRSSIVAQFSEAIENLPDEIRTRNTIVVCSYDMVYKQEGINFHIIILDESNSAKNQSSLRHYDLRKIMTNNTPYSFIMTATPQDKTKFEIFCQFGLLSTLILNPKGRGAFIKRYWYLDDYGHPKKEIPTLIGEINKTISQLSISCVADDVLKIPVMKEPIICEPYKKESLDEYKKMIRDNILIHDGILFAGSNSANLRMFLREITNGFAYETTVSNPDDDIEDWKTTKVAHRINTIKIDELRKVFLTRTFDSAIIFTFFDEDNRIVAELMEELGLTYRSVLKMDRKKRDEIIKDFKAGVFDYLIIKPASGGVGLNLERTQTIHWFSIPDAWIDLKQGRGRVHRRGQTKEQQEYFYFGSPLDRDMYKNVAVKKKNYNDETFRHFVDMSKKKL